MDFYITAQCYKKEKNSDADALSFQFTSKVLLQLLLKLEKGDDYEDSSAINSVSQP